MKKDGGTQGTNFAPVFNNLPIYPYVYPLFIFRAIFVPSVPPPYSSKSYSYKLYIFTFLYFFIFNNISFYKTN